jgi:hypothetical protein
MSNPYYVSQVSAAHWHEYSYSVIYIISTRRAFGRCVLRANSTMGTPPIVFLDHKTTTPPVTTALDNGLK